MTALGVSPRGGGLSWRLFSVTWSWFKIKSHELVRCKKLLESKICFLQRVNLPLQKKVHSEWVDNREAVKLWFGTQHLGSDLLSKWEKVKIMMMHIYVIDVGDKKGIYKHKKAEYWLLIHLLSSPLYSWVMHVISIQCLKGHFPVKHVLHLKN